MQVPLMCLLLERTQNPKKLPDDENMEGNRFSFKPTEKHGALSTVILAQCHQTYDTYDVKIIQLYSLQYYIHEKLLLKKYKCHGKCYSYILTLFQTDFKLVPSFIKEGSGTKVILKQKFRSWLCQKEFTSHNCRSVKGKDHTLTRNT